MQYLRLLRLTQTASLTPKKEKQNTQPPHSDVKQPFSEWERHTVILLQLCVTFWDVFCFPPESGEPSVDNLIPSTATVFE